MMMGASAEHLSLGPVKSTKENTPWNFYLTFFVIKQLRKYGASMLQGDLS